MDKTCLWSRIAQRIVDQNPQDYKSGTYNTINIKRCQAIVKDEINYPNICYYRQCLNSISIKTIAGEKTPEFNLLCYPHKVHQQDSKKAVPLWTNVKNPGLSVEEIDENGRIISEDIKLGILGNIPTSDKIKNQSQHRINTEKTLKGLIKEYKSIIDFQKTIQNKTAKEASVENKKIVSIKQQIIDILNLMEKRAVDDLDWQIHRVDNTL